MPKPDETREEALSRLNAQAEALEARTAPPASGYQGVSAASYGYRLMGLLIGGVFVGLGFGVVADVLIKTTPWGMIVGLLVGFTVSIWMVVRSARAITAETEKVWGPPRDLPSEDEDDD